MESSITVGPTTSSLAAFGLDGFSSLVCPPPFFKLNRNFLEKAYLQTNEISVETIHFHKVFVCSLFGNFTFAKDTYNICVSDSCQSVSYHNCCPSFAHSIQSVLKMLV